VPPPDDDARPATLGDVRGLRRWLWVTAAWAAAATAIAIIALLDQNEPKQRGPDPNVRITKLQTDIGGRLSRLETRVNGLNVREDVQRLESRLAKIERQQAEAAKTQKASGDADKKQDTSLADIEKRLAAQEKATQALAQTVSRQRSTGR
jgi:uncharacterized coiled-coil protein SlyX